MENGGKILIIFYERFLSQSFLTKPCNNCPFHRIRLAIIDKIPTLAKQLGKNFFSDKLSGLCVAWLGDDIASIRQAAAINLQVSIILPNKKTEMKQMTINLINFNNSLILHRN